MPDALASFSAALAGRYRIERELGSSGMATIYLAEDVRHRRRGALEALHPESSAVLGPERFLTEIEPRHIVVTSNRLAELTARVSR